ncbi:MAG: hypothetical protein GXO83_00370 [Chlorobi bacterium]|nr:hypothetical protein [Chlorobiota bacterium]
MKPGKNISLILLSLWLTAVITGFSIPGQHCAADNALMTVDVSSTTTNNQTNCCVNEDIHFNLATQVYYTPVKIHAPEKPVIELKNPFYAATGGLNELYIASQPLSNRRILSHAKIHLLTGAFRL